MKKIFKKFCKWVSKNTSKIITVISLIVLILIILSFIDLFYQGYWEHNANDNTVILLYSISIILLTIIIILIAYNQLNHLNLTAKKSQDTNKNDFLLRIDNKYTSPEIIKARAIINQYYIATKYHMGKEKQWIKDYSDKNQIEKKRIEMVADEIESLGKNSDVEQNSERHMYLLNFLDFLETIAYFCNQKAVDERQVSALLGDSLCFYYDIFENWIKHRQKKFGGEMYREIVILTGNLKKKYYRSQA